MDQLVRFIGLLDWKEARQPSEYQWPQSSECQAAIANVNRQYRREVRRMGLTLAPSKAPRQFQELIFRLLREMVEQDALQASTVIRLLDHYDRSPVHLQAEALQRLKAARNAMRVHVEAMPALVSDSESEDESINRVSEALRRVTKLREDQGHKDFVSVQIKRMIRIAGAESESKTTKE